MTMALVNCSILKTLTRYFLLILYLKKLYEWAWLRVDSEDHRLLLHCDTSGSVWVGGEMHILTTYVASKPYIWQMKVTQSIEIGGTHILKLIRQLFCRLCSTVCCDSLSACGCLTHNLLIYLSTKLFQLKLHVFF